MKKIILTLSLISWCFFDSLAQECTVDDAARKEVIKNFTAGDKEILTKLAPCYSLDRKLIIQISLLDYTQFNNADAILKKDEGFVHQIIKVRPNSLQFADSKILDNANFMEQATYIYRDALKYASPRLLDNRAFMSKMIIIDSRNYLFASEKIKSDLELAKIAFSDNGNLLTSAPSSIKSNKELVKIAMISDVLALNFAADNLKEDKELKKIFSSYKDEEIDQTELKKFLEENYIVKSRKNGLGIDFINRAKFSKNEAIINHNYITKWQRDSIIKNAQRVEDLSLISADKRNYAATWKDDFKKYPQLISKVEQFFLRHNLDQNTIDNLSTTFFWKVKNNPDTYVFNLYLMRGSMITELGSDFSNVTSLTAIIQERQKDWKLSVVEVIFDSEIPVNVSYNNGHKRYIFWDLYDKLNPKIIFKVEDSFNNYFEIFAERKSGKYQMISRIELEDKKESKK